MRRYTRVFTSHIGDFIRSDRFRHNLDNFAVRFGATTLAAVTIFHMLTRRTNELTMKERDLMEYRKELSSIEKAMDVVINRSVGMYRHMYISIIRTSNLSLSLALFISLMGICSTLILCIYYMYMYSGSSHILLSYRDAVM